MSISLNDHENRIKVLENKSNSGGYTEMNLVWGNTTDRNVTLSKPLSQFNAVRIRHIYGGSNTNDFEDLTIPVSELKSNKIGISVPDGTGYVAYINDTTLNLQGGRRGYIYGITGIKWGGGINLGTLLKRLLVYIKTYSKLFHLQFLEVK